MKSPLLLLKESSNELSSRGSWNLMQPEVGVDKPLGEFWNHITWNNKIQNVVIKCSKQMLKCISVFRGMLVLAKVNAKKK